jgi:hypothetical protein
MALRPRVYARLPSSMVPERNGGSMYTNKMRLVPGNSEDTLRKAWVTPRQISETQIESRPETGPDCRRLLSQVKR